MFKKRESFQVQYYHDLDSFSNDLIESMTAIQRPITDYNKTFNELEGNRLTELLNAIELMADPSVPISHQISNFWDAVHVMHLKLDIDSRKLVKMTKSLSAFRAIDENDKIILIKFSSIEIVIIRMILYFDFQFEYWNIITVSFMHSIVYWY